MGLIADKLKETVDKNERLKTGNTVAIITSYDHRSNTASIAFNDPTGGGILNMDNVKIRISDGGVSCSAPQRNQKCWISFMNGNLLSPVIVSFFSEKYYNEIYSKKTSSTQGAFLVDPNIKSISTELSDFTPMVEDWMDYDNTDKEKYYSPNLTDYVNMDIDQEVFYNIVELDKYKKQEDGITNLQTKSTIKLKEDGSIDIFVDNNTGIRINPSSKSISFFGKTIESYTGSNWIIHGNVNIDGTLIVSKGIKGEFI